VEVSHSEGVQRFSIVANGPWSLAVYEGSNGGPAAAFPTPTPFPTATPTPTVLFSFTGSGTANPGPSFTVGETWTSVWSCTSSNAADTLDVVVMRDGVNWGQANGTPCNGENYTGADPYSGWSIGFTPGTYHLDLFTNGNWTVLIRKWPKP
jgi:hypothetical protein